MTTTTPTTYAAWLTDLREIALQAQEDVQEACYASGGLPKRTRRRMLRRAVHKYAVHTLWFQSKELIPIALQYCDRYALDDEQVSIYLRKGHEADPAEWERALLSACIYYHVVHSLT